MMILRDKDQGSGNHDDEKHSQGKHTELTLEQFCKVLECGIAKASKDSNMGT